MSQKRDSTIPISVGQALEWHKVTSARNPKPNDLVIECTDGSTSILSRIIPADISDNGSLKLEHALQDSFASRAAALFTKLGPGTNLLWEKAASWDEPTNVGFGEELLTKLTEGLKGSDTMNLYQAYVVELTTYNVYKHGPILAKNKNPARDKVLTWLISEATHPISGSKIFDGDIEHYHIVVHEIASCIPDKIIDK